MSRIGGYARAEHILILAWAFVLIRLAWPELIPAPTGAVLMAAYIALSLPRLRRRTLVLCTLLALMTVILAAVSQSWRLVLPALDGATIFGAFFGTIMVLRATADQRPDTSNARVMFQRLGADQKSGAFLIGAHLTKLFHKLVGFFVGPWHRKRCVLVLLQRESLVQHALLLLHQIAKVVELLAARLELTGQVFWNSIGGEVLQ